MGIEGFYKTLEKKNEKKTGIVKDFNNKTSTDFFFVDFNSIVHNISVIIDYDLAYILTSIIYNNSNKKINIIAEKWGYDLNTATVESYISYFTEDLIDKYTIQFIKEYIIKLLTTYIDQNIRKIFISVDGIPNMAKIIEQKQRKYMAYVRNGLIKKIFNKYQSRADFPKKRILFENTKVKFDRGKIVPWSPFMKNLEDALINKTWIDSIKHIFPKLEKFILSGSAYPGEGEKKIMEVIMDDIDNGITGNYTLYSPDADMILLSIILKNLSYIKNNQNKNRFFVLHYDQETKTHSFININKFSKYICTFITGTKDITERLIFNSTNDFVIISTVFGNDFVPKISSINVKTDFEEILELYKYMSGEYIVIAPDNIKGQFQINYDNLVKYLYRIANIEDDLIKQKYIVDNFNLGPIKKLIGNRFESGSVPSVYIYNFIKTYIGEYKKFVKTLITDQNISKLIDDYTGKQFLENFIILENVGNSYPEIRAIVRNILDNYRESGRIFPPLRAIRKNRKRKIQEFHIQKYLEDPSNKLHKLTDFDKDIILLDWKLGDYAKMLNSLMIDKDDINFGNLNKPVNRNYYYKSYLGIEPNDREKKQYILREYLFGLIWTFDFYFNKNSSVQNLSYVSTWFFPEHRAPLLKEIVQSLKYFVKNGKVNIFSDKIKRYLVPRNNFLNRYEQLLYTVPKNKIYPVIKGYEKLLENSDLFPDMDDYVNKIWNMSTSFQYIDCRRITFLTKCILKKVHNYSFNNFMSIIKPYRHFLNKSGYDFGYIKNNIEISYPTYEMRGGSNNNIVLNYYRESIKKLIHIHSCW